MTQQEQSLICWVVTHRNDILVKAIKGNDEKDEIKETDKLNRTVQS